VARVDTETKTEYVLRLGLPEARAILTAVEREWYRTESGTEEEACLADVLDALSGVLPE